MQPGNPGQDPYGEQPQQGGQPQWEPTQYPPPYTRPNNTQGLVSMILGIAGIPLVCCFSVGIPFGIAAIVLGIIGRRRVNRGLATNRGQATAGFICGIVAVVLGVVLIILSTVLRNADLPTEP